LRDLVPSAPTGAPDRKDDPEAVHESDQVSGFVEARTFGRERWERPVEAMEKKGKNRCPKKSVMTLPDMGL
jgi:hypothetical protein